MAKRKKKLTPSKAEPVPALHAAAPGTGVLWLSAAGGLFLLAGFFLFPWVSVLAADKSGVVLGIEALKAKSYFTALFLFSNLLVAALAGSLPWLPLSTSLRETLVTGATLATSLQFLATVILTKSTRNLLVFQTGGVQTVLGYAYLVFLSYVIILAGAFAYLAGRDYQTEKSFRELKWFGMFAAVLLAILIFNYKIIPESLIPPPEFIRERIRQLEWMQ